MITEQDLQEAIAECEGQRNPTSNTCMKLAAFYTIRDKMFPVKKEAEPQGYSYAAEPVVTRSKTAYESDTEFGKAIVGMSVDDIMPVIDELMSTLQILNPRLYAGVLRKLTSE